MGSASLSSKIIFCWASGHNGIPGNEAVDQMIKTATNFARINPNSFPSSHELVAFIRRAIHQDWHRKLRALFTQRNILAQIKRHPIPWLISDLPSRKLETTLTRLRIGHARLTHNNIISNLAPLNCRYCKNYDLLTLGHLFTCHQLTYIRNSHTIPTNDPILVKNSLLHSNHPVPSSALTDYSRMRS